MKPKVVKKTTPAVTKPTAPATIQADQRRRLESGQAASSAKSRKTGIHSACVVWSTIRMNGALFETSSNVVPTSAPKIAPAAVRGIAGSSLGGALFAATPNWHSWRGELVLAWQGSPPRAPLLIGAGHVPRLLPAPLTLTPGAEERCRRLGQCSD